LTTHVTGVLPLANGGTGSNLTHPNADRIVFWDDSAGAIAWLEFGAGLTITDTVLTGAGLYIPDFTSSGRWNKPAGATVVVVQLFGPGGGGASGAKGSPNGSGGGGGGGGGCNTQVFSAAVLGASETVTIGSGGAGGAAMSTPGDGANGSSGGVSS